MSDNQKGPGENLDETLLGPDALTANDETQLEPYKPNESTLLEPTPANTSTLLEEEASESVDDVRRLLEDEFPDAA